MRNIFVLLLLSYTFLVIAIPESFTDSTKLLFEMNAKMEEYYGKGDYKTAAEYAEKSLIITEHLYGKADSNYGESLNNLGFLYREMSKYDKSLPLFLDALENLEQSVSKNHFKYVNALNVLGQNYQAMGQYDKALPFFTEAVEITETTFGENHYEYGTALNNLGSVYQSMGIYTKALPLMLKALENYEKSLGKDHWWYGASLNNLGLIYKDLGQYKKAEPLLLESMHNIENSVGKDHPWYGIRLTSLGSLYKAVGKYDKALPLYVKALENTEKSLGKEHATYGARLTNLGGLYHTMGDYNSALPLLLEARDHVGKYMGEEHYGYVYALDHLGGLYHSMNQDEKALLLLLEGLERAQKTFGKEHPHYVRWVNDLGKLYNELDQIDKALPLFLEANELLGHRVSIIFPYLNEQEKFNFLTTLENYFEGYYSVAYNIKQKHPEFVGLNYSNTLTLKNLVLSSTRSFLQIIQTSSDSLISLKLSQWEEVRKQLAYQYGLPITKRWANVDSLEKLADEHEGALARLSAEFSESTKKVDWQDVQQFLGTKEAAIEFVNFRYYDKALTDSILYAALLLTKNLEYPEFIPLFEEAQLLSLLAKNDTLKNSQYINALYDPDQKGSQLTDLIWMPLEPYLGEINTVYYAPSGMLNTLSFSSLPTDIGYLFEKYNLVQLGSMRKLVSNMPVPLHSSATLYGGIYYEYDTTGSDAQYDKPLLPLNEVPGKEDITRGLVREGWSHLMGSVLETKTIARLFDKSNTTFQLVTSTEATEANFKALNGNSTQVIHISTHGFFFPDLKENDIEFKGDDLSFTYVENPLFRSGLLMAGGNYTWQHGYNPYEQEDGILTAYEISQLDLSHTDLVVLSACETGLGEIKGSEGVYGLQRAFKMAGVEYLIMSLWKVPDNQTVELMEAFYKNWLSGQPIRQAFRNAQQKLAEDYPPYYWASFVLVGGGKHIEIKINPSYSQVFVVAILAFVLTVTAIIYFRRRQTLP